MKARVVTPQELTSRDVAAWEACAAAAVEPNPFLEPAWLLPALAHLDESPRPALVLAEHGGQVYGCVPLFESVPEQDGIGANGVHSVINTRVAPTAVPVGTPLVAADRGAEALASMIVEIGHVAAGHATELVVLEWMVAGGPVEALLEEVADRMAVKLVQFETWERGFLRRRAGEDDYWLGAIGKNRRRTIRQHRRRLEEAIGADVTLRVATGGEAVEAFLRLETAGWKGHDPHGLALGRTPATAAFFREACAAGLDRGRLFFLSLEGPDGPVAMICCVRAGEGLFAYRTAYDERLARHGPGVQLFLDAMAYFDRATDAAWFDTCTTPGNEHLLGLFPDRRRLATFVTRVRPAP